MATTTLVSLSEFERLPEDGTRHELSDGELVTMTHPKYEHNEAAHAVFLELHRLCKALKIGKARMEMAYLLHEDPPTLRVPDVSIASPAQTAEIAAHGYLSGAPLLAVEIVSPTDSAEDLNRKVHQYLDAGAREVWVVYPKMREIIVHAADGIRSFSEDAQLESRMLEGEQIQVKNLLT